MFFFNKTSRPNVSPIILSAFLGLFSGAVGMLLAAAYLVPVMPSSSAVAPIRLARTPAAGDDRPEWADIRLESVTRATAVLYRGLPQSGGIFAGAFVPSEAIGAASVLTSDGWLVTHESALSGVDKGSRLIATINGKAYPIRDTVNDPYSGAVFLRVDGDNLPVATFGDDARVRAGDLLFAVDATGGLHRLEMTGTGERPAAKADDYVVSSEKIASVLRTADAGAILPGSAVIGADGGTVGIYVGHAVIGGAVIPLSSFFNRIASVLRDHKVSRPYLGVHFVDFSRVANLATDGNGQRRGALLQASIDGKSAAVARRSPAEKAGLRAGDIIVSLGGDEITAKRSLADILSEYEVGAGIKMGVLRDGAVREMNVVLGEAAIY